MSPRAPTLPDIPFSRRPDGRLVHLPDQLAQRRGRGPVRFSVHPQSLLTAQTRYAGLDKLIEIGQGLQDVYKRMIVPCRSNTRHTSSVAKDSGRISKERCGSSSRDVVMRSEIQREGCRHDGF